MGCRFCRQSSGALCTFAPCVRCLYYQLYVARAPSVRCPRVRTRALSTLHDIFSLLMVGGRNGHRPHKPQHRNQRPALSTLSPPTRTSFSPFSPARPIVAEAPGTPPIGDGTALDEECHREDRQLGLLENNNPGWADFPGCPGFPNCCALAGIQPIADGKLCQELRPYSVVWGAKRVGGEGVDVRFCEFSRRRRSQK